MSIDPEKIFYSLPTINDALPEDDPSAELKDRDLVIHEDDWRQFEAVSSGCQRAVEEELAAVQRIFHEESEMSGEYRIFREIHIRTRLPRPLSPPLNWSELLSACGVQPSAVAGLGIERWINSVRGGFSFSVGRLTFFGVRHGPAAHALCLDCASRPGLSEERAQSIAAFMGKSDVMLIHWPSASVLADEEAMRNYFRQS